VTSGLRKKGAKSGRDGNGNGDGDVDGRSLSCSCPRSTPDEEVATGNDLWLAVLAKAASQFRSSVCLVIRWALRRMWGPTQIAPRFVECVGC